MLIVLLSALIAASKLSFGCGLLTTSVVVLSDISGSCLSSSVVALRVTVNGLSPIFKSLALGLTLKDNTTLLSGLMVGNFTPCSRSPVISFGSIAPVRLKPAGNTAVMLALCRSMLPVLVKVAVSLAVSSVFIVELLASSFKLNLGCGFGFGTGAIIKCLTVMVFAPLPQSSTVAAAKNNTLSPLNTSGVVNVMV